MREKTRDAASQGDTVSQQTDESLDCMHLLGAITAEEHAVPGATFIASYRHLEKILYSP